MRFFISYSRSVKTDVSRIVDLLQAKGHEVWWDADIPPGQAWWATILDKIEWCEIFVFVVSEKSVQSPYCLAELKYATDRNRPILPFIIDPPASYPIPPVVTPRLNQWLPYDGNIEQAAEDITLAAAGLDQSLYADQPGARPPEPGKNHKTLTNQLQQALTLADEGHFEEALKHFREVDALDHKAWGELCRTWIAKIMAYREVADLADHPRTLRLARTHWETYSKTYNDEDGLFDPLNIAKMLVPTNPVSTPSIQMDNTLAVDKSPVSAQISESKPKVDASREGQTFRSMMSGVSVLVAAVFLMLIAMFVVDRLRTPVDPMADQSIAQATDQAIEPRPSNTAPISTDTAIEITGITGKVVEPLPTDPLPVLTVMSLPTEVYGVQIALTPIVSNSDWAVVEQDFNGVAMVLVPAGCFRMGGSEFEDEKPPHEQCFVEPFWIDKYEVTNGQFALFNGKADAPGSWSDENYPRESVTWFEAHDFCTLRGTRLPNEREWEYAARGPDNRVYPWGNTWDDNKAVWHETAGGQTADVGSRPEAVSWVGTFHMSGNVWEWVSTIYGVETQGDTDFTDEGEKTFLYPYVSNDGREQASEDLSNGRVFRGGGWMSTEPNNLRSAHRGWLYPNTSQDYVGFRCARDV